MIEPGPSSAASLSGLPDAVPNLAVRLAPAAWRPFIQLARIDRPIGWWLLLLPCWQSAALAGIAGHRAPNVLHLALFLVGAIAMRGAGSTYNDLIDRKIDAQVERTRNRPLATGAVSPRAAKIFMVAQALAGACVLFSLNSVAIVTGLVSLLPVAIYPYMKRITSWPQAVLGLAFAYGGLMGWVASFGSLSWPAFALYGSAILWTIGYDTIYALQDARDDAVIGVRSTARLFGAHVRNGVGVLYLGTLCLALAAIVGAGGGIAAHLGLLAYALHLTWQVRNIDAQNPAVALRLFRSNRNAGLILFAGLSIDALVQAGLLVPA